MVLHEKADNFISRFTNRIVKTRFVQTALKDNADLSKFRQKPTGREMAGLFAIFISYIIGWPFIAILGIVAGYVHRPLIIVIGGPFMYLMSHLTFILGMYLAGVNYAKAFIRWATKVLVLKLLYGSCKYQSQKDLKN
jgi:hypothetical protein